MARWIIWQAKLGGIKLPFYRFSSKTQSGFIARGFARTPQSARRKAEMAYFRGRI